MLLLAAAAPKAPGVVASPVEYCEVALLIKLLTATIWEAGIRFDKSICRGVLEGSLTSAAIRDTNGFLPALPVRVAAM